MLTLPLTKLIIRKSLIGETVRFLGLLEKDWGPENKEQNCFCKGCLAVKNDNVGV